MRVNDWFRMLVLFIALAMTGCESPQEEAAEETAEGEATIETTFEEGALEVDEDVEMGTDMDMGTEIDEPPFDTTTRETGGYEQRSGGGDGDQGDEGDEHL